jgi:hypothetical protein
MKLPSAVSSRRRKLKLKRKNASTTAPTIRTRHARRRRKSCEAVLFAIRSPGNRTAAEMKIGALGVAMRPAASLRSKRKNFFSSGRTWVDEGGIGGNGVGGSEIGGGGVVYLGVRHDGRLWLRRRRWLDGEGLRFDGAAVCPRRSRNREGGLLDLVDRNHPRSQKAKHDVDAVWSVAIAALPTSNTSRADAKQSRSVVLCNAERVQRLTELARNGSA